MGQFDDFKTNTDDVIAKIEMGHDRIVARVRFHVEESRIFTSEDSTETMTGESLWRSIAFSLIRDGKDACVA